MQDTKVQLFNYLKENPDKIDEVLAQAPATPPVVTSGAAMNKRTYTPKSPEARLAQYEKERDAREAGLKQRLSFISPAFDPIFKLNRGLVLIGGQSGHSKSTAVGNLLAGFLTETKNETAVVITNEESGESVINRTACVLAKQNFMSLHRGLMYSTQRALVDREVLNVVPRVEVVDDAAFEMGCIEDVQAVLEYAAKRNVRLVIVDYLQTVAFSREKPYLEPFQISKLFGLYLKDYGKRAGVPVVVFCQLKPNSESPDIASRIQNDKTIYNHAFAVVELVPDFKNRTTKFVFHKDRFGEVQGAEITMKFVDGRFEPMPDEL